MTHDVPPASLPAPRAVPAGRRRTFFGLFDADGWSWAIVKASFWFVLIITLLGYIPDRAYYFTVQRTVDLWPAAPFLQWSPINFCPPENETLPCPAPAGATLPWHPAPTEIQLPAGRTDGAAAVIGQTYLYAGGSDGKAAVATTYVSHAVGTGNLDKWSEGPALPEARSDAAYLAFGDTLYLFGGYGPDGAPTTTAYSLTVGSDGTLGEWKADDCAGAPRAARRRQRGDGLGRGRGHGRDGRHGAHAERVEEPADRLGRARALGGPAAAVRGERATASRCTSATSSSSSAAGTSRASR